MDRVRYVLVSMRVRFHLIIIVSQLNCKTIFGWVFWSLTPIFCVLKTVVCALMFDKLPPLRKMQQVFLSITVTKCSHSVGDVQHGVVLW